jgi:hypothetical protein
MALCILQDTETKCPKLGSARYGNILRIYILMNSLIQYIKYTWKKIKMIFGTVFDWLPWIIRVLKAVLRIRIRMHMFLGLPDPDPLVRGMDPDPDPSIISKNSKKNLDSYYFVTLFDFLSCWKIMLMYLQKVISRRKKLIFCWHLEGQWRK